MTPRLRHHLARARSTARSLAATARLLAPSARLLTGTEAHTYAYSVAANALLASLPFLCLMLWIARHLVPELGNQVAVVKQLVAAYLPVGPLGQADLLNDALAMSGRHTLQVFSLFMLALSASGVFLPLEVGLNSIWGFQPNRSYLRNQAVSLLLVLACGTIAYATVLLSGLGQAGVAVLLPAGWIWPLRIFNWIWLQLFAVPATIGVFFLIYWWLPNGPVPPAQVFPAAFYTGLAAVALKYIFEWTLPWLNFHAVYGASLGLAVTLLVWGYAAALLLLFGASLSARAALKMPQIRLRAEKHPATVL